MLSFDIRTLSQGAVQVEGDLNADDPVWLEGDARPVSSVHVTGRLSSAGSGRYYFSGSFTGTAAGECRRCLVPVESAVRGDAHLLYADANDENADEPDVFPIGEMGTMLDLAPRSVSSGCWTLPRSRCAGPAARGCARRAGPT